MDASVSSVPKNCNGCKFKQIVSKHWELEDYCALNNKSINRMNMKKDCPLWGGGELCTEYRIAGNV